MIDASRGEMPLTRSECDGSSYFIGRDGCDMLVFYFYCPRFA
jgi:hypothetical protein